MELLTGYLSREWEGDYRVKDFLFMRNPYPTIVVSAFYVYVVKYLGPNLMRNRKPFELKYLMIAYNFFLVALNAVIFIGGGIYGWFGGYSYKCAPRDLTLSPGNKEMINVCWLFYVSKFIELLDTVFFVLRKKYCQISKLHLIHHAMLPISCWYIVKYVPVGHSTFLGFSNSLVHVLMYTYYGLAAIGPQMQPYLWWKKYLTKAQMVQFVVMFLHSVQLFWRSCDFPLWFVWFNIFHAVLFMVLFMDFYRKTYRQKLSS